MMKTLATGMALLAALVFAAVTPAQASCTLTTQVVFHGLGSWFDNCPDAQPVGAYAYLISNPAANNSAGQDLVCEDNSGTNSIGVSCQFECGVSGDGKVTIQYDWGIGNSGALGCPNPVGDGDGSTPVAVQVTCNNGASLLVTTGYLVSLGGFEMEIAQPLNSTGDGADPLSASFVNGPTVTGSASATSVCVNVPVPTIFSDCDPTSVGAALGQCTTAGLSRPTTARGNLYTIQAACGTSPDPRLTQGWTVLPNPPNAAGDACNTLPAAGAGLCNFIADTGIIGGNETLAVLGSLQVAGPGAATDKVKIDSAAFAQGRLKVGFSTENEATIVGFNVYAGSARLNAGLIAAKGVGSNAYSFEIGRGAVKANRSVVVEAIKSDGTVEKTAPYALK
jgi:hypothetical protein